MSTVGAVRERPLQISRHFAYQIKAKEHLKLDVTAFYIATGQAPEAIEEAIAAEIPLIVAVATRDAKVQTGSPATTNDRKI